ncbi:MAG TPA: precorrin-6y C5,15-methyltransferase (decarboxylating) subunit CbiE [Nitrospirae bacterium]|nr:sirohydrochlorin cobaltochelatase [bacterium BMS3Bbin09]HDN95339.1 precorrin-6y C5,15-methyltransferase (decarboxylating) subunit CbiE [Nitrospirota bacterium]HDO66714.1 precorrin-6y C5,15-methyltransferase (decarboxylating) subunit CbiE [Nitrospirota bacterium]HDY71104.1 precorrin-6y C5,15-methyltransferase (decarboxylating) subunit CbiE [Nitrospirota bacterium]HEW80888.1 precorrin-6y C5,15-methyltransferase (decarboxylating) subunit CbiE [Nitrospirota bacterium]
MERIIIAGHGSHRKDDSNIEQIAELLHNIIHPGCGDDCVKAAYLQFLKPDIMETLTACVKEGAKKIIVHPYFLSSGTHVSTNIPEIIKEVKAQYPDITFVYTKPLGIHKKMAEVVRERIAAASGLGPEEIENKIHVIGIGFRPLEQKASRVLLGSDVVLSNGRLLDVFKGYAEYEDVKEKIVVHPTVYEMLDYIDDNYTEKTISLLAAGDPMFFGIGRLIIERFGMDEAEIYPDLSSVQVAFSRVKKTENNALMISLHGGPDPSKRRKPKYEIIEIPRLLAGHGKVGVLTDRENNPSKIAEELMKPSAVGCQLSAVTMYVCEKIGYNDEKIIQGAPETIAGMSFAYPNVVILVSAEEASAQGIEDVS